MGLVYTCSRLFARSPGMLGVQTLFLLHLLFMLYMLTVTLVERMVSQAVGGLKLRCSEPDIDKTIYNYIATPPHPISPHVTTPPHHAGHCTIWTYMVVRVGVNISILHQPNVTRLDEILNSAISRKQQITRNCHRYVDVTSSVFPTTPNFCIGEKFPIAMSTCA